MSIQLEGATIMLCGPCRVEDAEPLVLLLQADPSRNVALEEAGDLHAAVVQVLLALRPRVAGHVADPFTAAWLLPLLAPPVDSAAASTITMTV